MIINHRIITLIIVVTCVPTLCTCRRPALRIYKGVPDTKGKYSYVVALLVKGKIRTCTGTLITQEWVITAGHCLQRDVTHVQYGNLTLTLLSRIIRRIRHPSFFVSETIRNDIGLLRISPLRIKVGNLSAVDYTTLLGRAVEFAGYGMTQKMLQGKVKIDQVKFDLNRSLQLGEGVVTSCEYNIQDMQFRSVSAGPFMCVTAKCSNNKQHGEVGDSGGPLFCDSKIIGVTSWGLADRSIPATAFTPVSPYLTWIYDTINRKRKIKKEKKKKVSKP